MSDHDFFSFLEKRIGFLDGVVISGGEPTLTEHLPAMCERIKSMGFSLKIDTNGSRPHVIRSLLAEGLLDYVAMDIKADLDGYSALMNRAESAEQVLESVRIIMASDVDHEFRTTCVKPFVDPTVMEKMAGMIQGARRYVLQPFRTTRILNSDYFRGLEPGYTSEEMKTLRAVAEPFVRECLIRR